MSAARTRRRWRRPVLVLAAALLVLLGTGWLVDVLRGVPGDPGSDRDQGASALRRLVAAEGVDVRVAGSVPSAARDAAAPHTLVVHAADRLRPADWERLWASAPAEVVLLSPDAATLEAAGLAVRTVDAAGVGADQPGCADPAARRAGTTAGAAGAPGYSTEDAEIACYPAPGTGHRYLRLTSRGATVHLLGTGWANGELLTEGNASFAMQVLGRQPALVWLNDPDPVAEPAAGPPSLLPPWWALLGAQASVGFVLLLLWRGRRLGPVLTEQLPVVVPAGEAVTGHGRLYHRMGAREHAAAVLRAGTVGRLSRRLGPADPLALVTTVHASTELEPAWLREVLTGPPPADDDALARLALQLAEAERRVHEPGRPAARTPETTVERTSR
ncbi:DUF4350 domain-containing protein [Desertihabitans brevis]|uniref:DUF4350 domain-containing protein n=1 Tax=Desertihabitans brevis TaxID=2268447 RepID=A0A367YV97_9ACTN|nr:DUF4350 domain-containing protein [Desertihabitans brevis]RCK69459.1 DUF4350 domain-containing protein [Desertihabitans brevis]